MLGEDHNCRDLAEKSYNAMTSNGDIELNLQIYKLSFLNFLLGRQPNGPGQFLFGDVGRCGAFFSIEYDALHSNEFNIESEKEPVYI